MWQKISQSGETNNLCFFIYFLFLSDERPMLIMLVLLLSIYINSAPIFLYFDLFSS